VLVFDIGTTAPYLTPELQDLRFVITERVVNGWPVWAAVGGKWFMFRSTNDETCITDDSTCATTWPYRTHSIFHATPNAAGVAPTELPSNGWLGKASAALPSQYASARPHSNKSVCKIVPNMRIKAVHGLGNDDPAMAEALVKLAALA
jgi:hypothetical protein